MEGGGGTCPSLSSPDKTDMMMKIPSILLSDCFKIHCLIKMESQIMCVSLD